MISATLSDNSSRSLSDKSHLAIICTPNMHTNSASISMYRSLFIIYAVTYHFINPSAIHITFVGILVI